MSAAPDMAAALRKALETLCELERASLPWESLVIVQRQIADTRAVLAALESACHGACDCGTLPHDRDCRALDVCDGETGAWCEKHWQEQLHEHGWMRGKPLSAVTGVMSEQDKQDLRDAGRGHLVRS